MARDIDLYNRNIGRGSRIPNIGLGAGTSGFAPATFQGTVFTPQKEDMSLLQRSLATLDERKENTDRQRAAIMTALGNVQLDANEDKWKYDYANRISSAIDKAAQFGDYSTALETATRLAGEAIVSPELKGRQRYYEQRQKEIETLNQRKDISQATKEWWLYNNPYSYQDKYDKEGNIVGGTEFNPETRPVSDVNWDEMAATAFKLVTKSHTSSASTSGDAEGNRRGGSSQVEAVKREDIISNMRELLLNNPDAFAQVEQAWQVANHQYTKMLEDLKVLPANDSKRRTLEQQIEMRRQMLFKNGSEVSLADYMTRNIENSSYAKNLAYRWTDSSSTNITGGSPGTNPTSPYKGQVGFDFATGNYVSEQGFIVEKKGDVYYETTELADAAVTGVNASFGKYNNK